MRNRVCQCGAAIGPRAPFCRNCRRRRLRRSRAGLPADAYPNSGRRGQLPLGALTRTERHALELTAAIADAHAAGYQDGRLDGVREAVARYLELERQRARELDNQ